jgi:hypothetical protein
MLSFVRRWTDRRRRGRRTAVINRALASRREVIRAADERDLAMVFTGMRHFPMKGPSHTSRTHLSSTVTLVY